MKINQLSSIVTGLLREKYGSLPQTRDGLHPLTTGRVTYYTSPCGLHVGEAPPEEPLFISQFPDSQINLKSRYIMSDPLWI